MAQKLVHCSAPRGEAGQQVAFRLPGELPNDGKVIEDARKFD